MKLFNLYGIAATLVLATACDRGEVILPGARQDVRTAVISGAGEGADAAATDFAPKPGTAAPISVGAARANASWTHPGGSAEHYAGNVALSAAPRPIWTASIGRAADRRHRITASPVVAGGRIFTLDSRATVAATSTSGAALWRTDLTPPSERPDDASGGGLAFGEGMVFATTGFGELVALDPATGRIAWRQRLGAAAGGAPAVSGGRVYVVARDATAWSVNARDGKVDWTLPAAPSAAGVTGATSPAVDARQVILPFGSGQIVAVDKTNAQGLWQGNLAGGRLGRAYARISDLTGDPVITGGVVYSGTSAGRLAAFDADTGLTLWSAGDGATGPAAVAGGSVFVVNDEDQLLRLSARSGETIWRVDLPYFTEARDKKRKGIYAHYGPILAGGRLRLASSDGLLRSFDPVSGALTSAQPLGAPAAAAPAVAQGTFYVVTKDGQLRAFR